MKKNDDNANDKEDKGRRFREQYTYTAIHGTQNNISQNGLLTFPLLNSNLSISIYWFW